MALDGRTDEVMDWWFSSVIGCDSFTNSHGIGDAADILGICGVPILAEIDKFFKALHVTVKKS